MYLKLIIKLKYYRHLQFLNILIRVVVCANSAKYVPGKYDSNPSPPNNVMTDQWENQKVKDLKLPIEKWAFVCCNADVSASTKINNLLKDYPFIDGFIMDFEDPKSVTAFSTEFKKLKKKYKFGLIGFRGNLDGWKSWASQHGGLSFDYYFNELYTEGMYEGQTTSFYNTGKMRILLAMQCVHLMIKLV